MNENSYSELMKSGAKKRNRSKENYVQDLYIDMLLSEIQLKMEKERILRKIDSAIDRRDKKSFLSFSKELNEINKRFGS